MMTTHDPFSLEITLPSDTEIKMVRSFRAPKELVFDAFTKAEHVRNWQGPYALKCTECEFDARVGGLWNTSYEDPAGNTYKFNGEFLEVERPNKAKATFEFHPDENTTYIQTNTNWFEEEDGVTKVTIISSFDSQEGRDGMLHSGMEGGMTEGYERLDNLLAGMQEKSK